VVRVDDAVAHLELDVRERLYLKILEVLFN
jgi:hypothetical protein